MAESTISNWLSAFEMMQRNSELPGVRHIPGPSGAVLPQDVSSLCPSLRPSFPKGQYVHEPFKTLESPMLAS